jgi:hypothetical protein
MKRLIQYKKLIRWKRVQCILAAGFFITFCATACQTSKPVKVKDTMIEGTNLYEVANPSVRVAYIDPYVDYDQYKKIMVTPLNFDMMEIIQPSDTRFKTKFELNEEEREKINEIYQKMMLEYLEKKGDFEVVENPGPDVLTLSVYVKQIKPNAPKDDVSSRGVGQSTIYSRGAGSMTIAATVYDSTSGKELARIADTRESSDMWGVNNRVTNTGDISRAFAEWAKKFNTALKNLHDYEIEK